MKRSVDANGIIRTRINKKFILNTVDGMKSYNRREEEEDCWRQHRLEEEAHHRVTLPTNRRRENNLNREVPKRTPTIHIDDERKFWADKKARAMTSLESAGSHTAPDEHSAVEVESEIPSDTRDEHRKSKKRKRERRIEEAKMRCDNDGKGSSDERRRCNERKRERRNHEAKLRYEDKEGGRPRDDFIDHKESDRKRKKSKKHSKVERKTHKKRRNDKR